MARIRSLKPEFWTDHRMSRMSALARLTYICLWSMADDEGRIEGDAETVWRFGGFREDSRMIANVLDELCLVGRVQSYQVADNPYLFLPYFSKHQRIDHAKESKLPPPPKTCGESCTTEQESSRIVANIREASEIPREASLPRVRAQDAVHDPIHDPDPEGGVGGEPFHGEVAQPPDPNPELARVANKAETLFCDMSVGMWVRGAIQTWPLAWIEEAVIRCHAAGVNRPKPWMTSVLRDWAKAGGPPESSAPSRRNGQAPPKKPAMSADKFAEIFQATLNDPTHPNHAERVAELAARRQREAKGGAA